jgi:cytochrome P450
MLLVGYLDGSTLLTISVTSYILYYLTSTLYSAFLGPLSQIPGPLSRKLSILPFVLGHLTGTDHTDHASLHERCGSVVRVAPKIVYFLGNSKTWQQIYGFQTNHIQKKIYRDPIFYETWDENWKPTLVDVVDYDLHMLHRKLVLPAFSTRTLKHHLPKIKEWASKLRRALAAKIVTGEKVDMMQTINYTTFDIMGDMVFSKPFDMLDNQEFSPWVMSIFSGFKAGTALRGLAYLSNPLKFFIQNCLLKLPLIQAQASKHFQDTIDRVEDRRSRAGQCVDLWSVIMEEGKGNVSFTLAEQYSLGALFMIAGSETTATVLMGALYFLMKAPHYIATIREELDKHRANSDDFDFDALAVNFPFLDAVLKETMRLYPPLPIALPRIVSQGGAVIDGHFIPEGTMVGIHQFASHRDPSKWREGTQFRPERWMVAHNSRDDKHSRFNADQHDAFEPFQVGPQNCAGKVESFSSSFRSIPLFPIFPLSLLLFNSPPHSSRKHNHERTKTKREGKNENRTSLGTRCA